MQHAFGISVAGFCVGLDAVKNVGQGAIESIIDWS
jgi:hypothetical protein